MIRTLKYSQNAFKFCNKNPLQHILPLKLQSRTFNGYPSLRHMDTYVITNKLHKERCKNSKRSGLNRYFSGSQILLYTTGSLPNSNTGQKEIPLNDIKPQKPKSLIAKYASLSKFRLSSLVIFTASLGNLLAPGPINYVVFTAATLGTALTCFSANSINQYIEVDNDFNMKRTRNRMLPSGQMSLGHALAFGITTGTIGTCVLALYTTPLAAALAFSNILLYTLVYTPMKRVHPINTWIGSVVGAIPPMIGWAAQTGGLEPGAWVLCAILLLWQMCHFYALSYPLRFDYGNAGYKMLANVHPEKVAPKTLFYTATLLALAPLSSFVGLTSMYFTIDATILTSAYIYSSYKFYLNPTNESAMKSFKWSVYYLPVFLLLMFVHLNFTKDEDEDEKELELIEAANDQ